LRLCIPKHRRRLAALVDVPCANTPALSRWPAETTAKIDRDAGDHHSRLQLTHNDCHHERHQENHDSHYPPEHTAGSARGGGVN
jgi:hypothetical protein